MENLNSFFEGKSFTSLLDIGTGSGQFIQTILDDINVSEIIGIDPGTGGFAEAKEKFQNDSIQFRQMYSEKLDFDDDKFDLITMSKTLHHLPHQTESFLEMKRVLKPDGFLILAEMFSDNLNNAEENQKIYHHTKSKIDRILGDYHHETWKKNEILDIIHENGFEVVFHFEQKFPENKIKTEDDRNLWMQRFDDEIARLVGKTEHENFQEFSKDFETRLKEFGIQNPTNIVAICKPI